MSLQDCFSSDLFSQPTTLFVADVYPHLFFAALIAYWKKQYNRSLHCLSLESHSFGQLCGLLQTTFLGESTTYFLGDISNLSKKEKAQLVAFLETYRGPHTVLLFATEKTPLPFGQVIMLEACTTKNSRVLLQLLHDRRTHTRAYSFMDRIVRETGSLTLEEGMQFLLYSTLVRDVASFIEEWLPRLKVGQQSLFTLSETFFSRDKNRFYQLWNNIKEKYPTQFWVTFWLEQFYRAHFYVCAKTDENIVLAKQVAYRLPFSFLQQYWRKWSRARLVQLSDACYKVDVRVKQGGSDLQLEKMLFEGLS